jgi:hypothetical protein
VDFNKKYWNVQAVLTGILNALYELHLPVLSAECIDSEKEK